MAIELKSEDILTSEQLEKHFKIYAGPGAGKTHFLVENVKNIVRTNDKIAKSKARKVLCITYTNAAVDEIKRRLDGYTDAVEVNTIHGFIIDNIIIPFQSDLKKIIKKDFDITIPSKVKLSSQIEGLGILHGCDRDEIYAFINSEASTSANLDYSKKVMGEVQVNIDKYLNENKRELQASSKIIKEHILSLKKYVWTKACKLTHDEILYFGYRILQENSTATYALRVKFPFIFVDEFQDTNPLQTLIIKHLGEKSTILGVIGDVAQSIYSFQEAKPSQFLHFTAPGDKELVEYSIKGNRRSPQSIVNLCNYFRKSESLSQISIKPFKSEEEKADIESITVKFVIGETPVSMALLEAVMQNEGVILTRSWAAAFNYIQGIDDEQRKALQSIYYNYNNSPIDIRSEISEHNNVTWVRSFKFMIMLYDAYRTSSFVDILNAFSLYFKISDLKKANVFTPAVIICIKKLLTETFKDLSEDSLVVEKISEFNCIVNSTEFDLLKSTIFSGEQFKLQCFSEYDDKIIEPLSSIKWITGQRLFKEVFSNDSKYMTVHQAKGLEWDKVIVSVNPSKRNDGTTLDALYSNPQILEETSAEEFTRIYYVACSRARKELYIHLPDDAKLVAVLQEKLDEFKNQNNCTLNYEIIR